MVVHEIKNKGACGNGGSKARSPFLSFFQKTLIRAYSLRNSFSTPLSQLQALGRTSALPSTLTTTPATVASVAGDDTVIQFTSREALLHQRPQRLLFLRNLDRDTAATSPSPLAPAGNAWSRLHCSFFFFCARPFLLPLLRKNIQTCGQHVSLL